MKRLTDNEENIMNYLWSSAEPLGLRELSDRSGVGYRSTYDFLENLKKKGFVGVDKVVSDPSSRGNHSLYGIRVTYAEYLFGNLIQKSMVVDVIKTGLKICTKEQRKQIKKLLNEMDKEGE